MVSTILFLKLAVVAFGAVVGCFLLAAVARWPILGLHGCLAVGFMATGISRYTGLPAGLAIDVILAWLVLVMFVRTARSGEWHRIQNPGTILVVVWCAFHVLQLLNPEAVSVVAWFYSVRGVAAYMVLIPLTLLMVTERQQLYGFVAHWGVWSVLAALWGIKQIHIGVTVTEQRWLDAGAAQTHVLFGRLRAFSFLSDTAQFGASMACSCLFFGVMSFAPIRVRWRVLCALTSMVCLYGMGLSGTRSAMGILVVGAAAFALVSRRWRIVIPSALLLVLVIIVMRFTFVGQGYYPIRRMREAFSPMEDRSFQVRLENQRRLIVYLQTRPMGGGVGSAGYWGMRFSPDSFLAQLALDSYYVRIAAESGPIGLSLIALLLAVFGGTGMVQYGRLRDPTYKVVYAGLYGVFVGVVVASYSNQYLGQIPTAVVVYTSMSAFVAGRRMEGDVDSASESPSPRGGLPLVQLTPPS